MKKLLEKFNIKPNNEQIFVRSLTHSSYLNEHDEMSGDLEKLEFMGDAVLQLLVSELIFKYSKASNEGKMSLLRAKLVCTESLSNLAKEVGIDKYILLGIGEEKSGGRDRKNILADAFESFMGAIYLDQGYDKSKEVIKLIFNKEIKEIDYDSLVDYKTKLQEIIQSDSRRSITYVEISRKGTSNKPTYEFSVMLDDEIELARGIGSSKKKAQQDAAKKALDKCAK